MIQFSPPHIDKKIIDEVIDSLKSGWITTGPKTKLFEKRITEYCGNQNTLCVSSATAGLELVLRWFGVGPCDEVIVPTYTYCATANVVAHCGAKPVMVDIGEDFNINTKNILKAINKNTKVIIPVDLAGFPCDYDEIYNVVEKKKSLFEPTGEIQKKLERILILSDAAHSLGAVYKNKKTGNLADISVFSFHAVKNLTTAEGGAIAFNLPQPFNNEEIYNYFNIYTLHGQNKDALAKTKIGNWKYDVIMPGYKANMPDILAAIGLIELERYEREILPKRKFIFDTYKNILSSYNWAIIPEYENGIKISSYHVFLLRIKDISEETRDSIISRIFEKQVSVNVHFQPLPLLSYYKNNGYNINDYPISYKKYANVISLPVYYNLSEEQISVVTHAVIDSVEEELNS